MERTDGQTDKKNKFMSIKYKQGPSLGKADDL